MKIIIGFDPGLANTGYGVIASDSKKIKMLTYGSIQTAAADPVGSRLFIIRKKVLELIKEFKPVYAGIESLFFAKNISSAIPVAQAKGVILVTLAEMGIEAVEYPPQDIKQAIVGHGRAEKFQVQDMVKLILNLQEVPKPDHAADALAAAICLLHRIPAKGGGFV